MKLDRDLTDDEVLARGPDHHLGCELHPGRPEVEHRHDISPKRPHPAVHVAHARGVQDIQEPGEQRIADAAHQVDIAPGWIPSIRSPITTCAPSSSAATKFGISSRS